MDWLKLKGCGAGTGTVLCLEFDAFGSMVEGKRWCKAIVGSMVFLLGCRWTLFKDAVWMDG